MVIELGDEFTVTVERSDKSGAVVDLSLNGSVEEPESVTIQLHNGVSFTIPWEQYQRGESA